MATLKLLHVLAAFVWMGTLLSLSRFLAYQAKEPPEFQLRLGKILKRVYFAADLPAMIVTVALGVVSLLLKDMNWKAPWLHMKLTLAFLLIVSDLFIGRQVVRYSKRPIEGGATRFKVYHTVIGLLLLGVLAAIYILKAKNFG